VVGVGPGPFTGLRVGVAAAEVLAMALGIPIRGVGSLDAVASQAVTETRFAGEFLVAADARRKEVYWARYAADGTRLDGPFVTAPDAVPALPTIGTGADLVASAVEGPRTLDAGHLALVGGRLPEQGLEPLYLRRPDAEVSTTRKSTLLQPRLTLRGVK
jgi:tRNA threonylcarbamoyl adenosine modification protein YeaZ